MLAARKGQRINFRCVWKDYGLGRFAFDDVHMALHSQKHNKGLTEYSD